MNSIQYLSIYSGWELGNNRRRRFDYEGDNISVIHLEELRGDQWVEVFRQTLGYNNSILISVTGKKL